MRIMIGYPIWNKEPMIEWLIRGVADYFLKAKFAGFTNVILGINIDHRKFGNPKCIPMDFSEYARRDLAQFNAKWSKLMGVQRIF